jgi:hypothetical protein
MPPVPLVARFLADSRGVAPGSERLVLFFLLLLSVAALAVFLYYTVLIIDALPDVVPAGLSPP